jgi:ankyrin repeat protein
MLDKQKLLYSGIECNSIHLVKKALKMGADPKLNDYWALRKAAYHGHLECVKLLIPLSDVKACDSLPLKLAAQHGHTKVVDELKKHYTEAELQELGVE